MRFILFRMYRKMIADNEDTMTAARFNRAQTFYV